MSASLTFQLTYWAPRCLAVLAGLWIILKSMRFVHKKVFTAVFPPIMDHITQVYNIKMNDFKLELFRELTDLKQQSKDPLTILEIGAGSGANFQYYPAGTIVVPVEPMETFDSYLKSNAEKCPDITVKEAVIAYGENMKTISDDSVDVVVVTLVLCSVRNVSAVMGEIRRILKPGGRFYYLEHVYSDQRNSWIQLAQRILNPVWELVNGCSLTRATWKDIESGGFSRVNYKKFSAPLPRGSAIVSPHVMGYAVK